MPTIYVYSPFTALMLAQATYCDGGGTHESGFGGLGMCCPIDIGGSQYIQAGTAVRFYGSSGIGSIRTIRRSGFCSPSPGSPWDDAVVVELYRYANASCYIGSLFYGHLANRVSDNVYNNPSGLQLGTIPSCCPTECYFGVHVHIGRDAYGTSRSFSCYSILYVNSTWFYSWYYNDGTC